MPHATTAVFPVETRTARNPTRLQRSSKQVRVLQRLYDNARSIYGQSSLQDSIEAMLRAKNRPLVTKALSLGLGSISKKSSDQSRRFKQLTIFTAIADALRRIWPDLKLYAQDPAFTKIDEAFLQSLGIDILRTPSADELGEGQSIIDQNTLVYSPFLTINAYRLLLESCPVELLVGDDFNSLLLKWENHTAEHREVERLAKLRIPQYQKRVVSGNGFWEESDKPFPMAMYWRKPGLRAVSSGQRKRIANLDAQKVDRLSLTLAKAKL